MSNTVQNDSNATWTLGAKEMTYFGYRVTRSAVAKLFRNLIKTGYTPGKIETKVGKLSNPRTATFYPAAGTLTVGCQKFSALNLLKIQNWAFSAPTTMVAKARKTTKGRKTTKK